MHDARLRNEEFGEDWKTEQLSGSSTDVVK